MLSRIIAAELFRFCDSRRLFMDSWLVGSRANFHATSLYPTAGPKWRLMIPVIHTNRGTWNPKPAPTPVSKHRIPLTIPRSPSHRGRVRLQVTAGPGFGNGKSAEYPGEDRE